MWIKGRTGGRVMAEKRGQIKSGFERSTRTWGAIVLQRGTFGGCNPQVFNICTTAVTLLECLESGDTESPGRGKGEGSRSIPSKRGRVLREGLGAALPSFASAGG